jgi:Tfp pilus assembly protein PilZ
VAAADEPGERRSSGLPRVPFVRRCAAEFEDTRSASAFLININVLGCYVALDELPRLGQRLVCRFRLPESENEVVVEGVVAWTNPRQQHPVHSLPPGFGVSFRNLSEANRKWIEAVMRDYAARRSANS